MATILKWCIKLDCAPGIGQICNVDAIADAAMNGIGHDAEALAVSTILHGIGFTQLVDGPNRFEVNGAAVAANFVRRLGFDTRRVQLVWDSVALHLTPSISLFWETEVALCARGIGVDFGTPDYACFDQAEIDAIVAAVPRLNMVRQCMGCAGQMSIPMATPNVYIKQHRPSETRPARSGMVQ